MASSNSKTAVVLKRLANGRRFLTALSPRLRTRPQLYRYVFKNRLSNFDWSVIRLVMPQGLVGALARHQQPPAQRFGEVVDRHPQDLGPHPQRVRAALLPRLVGEVAEEGQQARQ